MAWSVIKEAGVGRVPDPGPDLRGSPLQHPVYAARARDGSYLIVDETGRDKVVPYSFGCRTIRVDASGALLYDSSEHGIEDGFGCLMDDGCIGILRRTRWELLVVDPDGKALDCLRLDTFSKRLPKTVTWTCKGTFLLVFNNRVYNNDIVEIDRHGQLLWCLPQGPRHIGMVIHAELTPADTILVADPILHVAMELNRAGEVIWEFGERKHPSRRIDHLSTPLSITQLPDGRRLVADTRNHRVVLIDADAAGCELIPHDGTFRDPGFASLLDNGNYLVCDTGNSRVIELDARGYIAWYCGAPAVSRRLLSYPRSVEVTDSGAYLVADTAHDRIIEIRDEEISERPFLDEPGLFWPRCVRQLPGGSLLIADARNQRIVQVSPEGRVEKQLAEVLLDGEPCALQDPHDVRLLNNGRLLITDSHQDLVIEADWSGVVHLAVGRHGSVRLQDPHSAQQLDDGTTVVADTGNHRIVLVDRNGDALRELRTLQSDSCSLRLHNPRYVEVSSDGSMVIADTGHNRILAVDADGRVLWELSRFPELAQPLLNQPRWVKLLGNDEVVICDHFHHRILHVRNDARPVAAACAD